MRSTILALVLFASFAIGASANAGEAATSTPFQEMKTASCSGVCNFTFKKSKKIRVLHYVSCQSNASATDYGKITIYKGSKIISEQYIAQTYIAGSFVVFVLDGYVPVAKKHDIDITVYGATAAKCTINGEVL